MRGALGMIIKCLKALLAEAAAGFGGWMCVLWDCVVKRCLSAAWECGCYWFGEIHYQWNVMKCCLLISQDKQKCHRLCLVGWDLMSQMILQSSLQISLHLKSLITLLNSWARVVSWVKRAEPDWTVLHYWTVDVHVCLLKSCLSKIKSKCGAPNSLLSTFLLFNSEL